MQQPARAQRNQTEIIVHQEVDPEDKVQDILRQNYNDVGNRGEIDQKQYPKSTVPSLQVFSNESTSQSDSENQSKRRKTLSNKWKSKIIYKQVLVKNPSYTDKRKLQKDQSTLDSFLSNFKESKYLKSTVVVNSKYRQLKIFDFKIKNKGKMTEN